MVTPLRVDRTGSVALIRMSRPNTFLATEVTSLRSNLRIYMASLSLKQPGKPLMVSMRKASSTLNKISFRLKIIKNMPKIISDI